MISSQLQSQLFSKNATWQILCDRYSGDFWRRTAPPELEVEVWYMCVRVYLPRTEFNRGVSVFLSFWDYLDWFMMRSHDKSFRVQALLVRPNIFTVTSSQGAEGDLHTVHFNNWGNATCTCMLFKCLRNRIKEEIPYYWQLMKQSRFFAGQPVCHHIDAALSRMGFDALEDYLESRQRGTA